MNITHYVKWVPINGFEEYKIANNGLIKKNNLLQTIKKHPKSGYYFIRIYKKIGTVNKGYHLDLHTTVFTHFSNVPLQKGYQIHHKDFNFKNNHIDNLELLPKKEHYALHGKTLKNG